MNLIYLKINTGLGTYLWSNTKFSFWIFCARSKKYQNYSSLFIEQEEINGFLKLKRMSSIIVDVQKFLLKSQLEILFHKNFYMHIAQMTHSTIWLRTKYIHNLEYVSVFL